MSYCNQCGIQVNEGAKFCENCGGKLKSDEIQPEKNDSFENFAFWVAGFFIPLAGLILYLVYENKKSKSAKSAAKGAITGLITHVSLAILIFIMYIVGFGIVLSKLPWY